MKRKLLWEMLVLVALVALVGQIGFHTRVASAQSGGGYDLTWNTIDGGGGTSTGGAYSLSGTIGQPDAGSMSGGAYALNGGFWNDTIAGLQQLFLPLIRR